jgi:hypothetical protein
MILQKTIMKKSILSVALLAGVITLFSSCEKDPDPVPVIVGTWVREEYEISDPPAGFTSWDGAVQGSFGETGYTILFKQDGTYSRDFTDIVSDEGTYRLEGNQLEFSPDSSDDLSDIEDIPVIGLEFEVEGDITELRMTLSQVVTLFLASDASIAAAGGDLSNVPDEEWQPVDVTLLYKFNKLK